MPSLLTAFLLDLLLLAALLFLGVRVARLLAPNATRLEIAAVSFPLGAGSLSYVWFLASWVGVAINLASLIAVGLGLIFLVGRARRLMGARPGADVAVTEAEGRGSGTGLVSWSIWAMVVGMAALSMVISVGRSYTPWDAAAIWAVKGYGIARGGTVFSGNAWGAHGLAYPLNIPLLISMFRLVTGDILPGSKLIFPMFFVSTIAGTIAFWRRLGLPEWWILPGVVIMGTIPEVFRHATYGYANVPFASYLVLGTLWGAVGLARRSFQHVSLGAALLALSIWTRPEGILYVAAVLAALFASSPLIRQGDIPMLRLIAPIAAVGIPWTAFYLIHGMRGSETGGAMATALDHWKLGDFRVDNLRLILGYFRRSVFDTRNWGLLFAVSAPLMAIRWRKLVDRAIPEITILTLAALTMGLVTGALFYVGSYVKEGLFAWLTRSFPRAFFPSAMLLVPIAFAIVGGKDRLAAGSSE